ncbi:MAG: glycine--tRNA ligase subunit beta [Ignavibacteriales bacterium]
MEKELILEIGTEEIPAGFLEEAIKNLGDIAEREFKDNLLSYKNINTFGTPRRLALRVTGLSDKQNDKIDEIVGPPKRIAYDESGSPTKAAIGFAKAQGVDVKDLVVISREKGEFIAVKREIKGQKTERVLAELLPKIILSIPFRKSMRWGDDDDTTFARPIRWILSLYSGKKVSFELGEIKSNSKTRGHRFISPKPFRVKDWEEYVTELEKRFVILDGEKRKEIIRGDIEQIGKETDGIPLEDEELLETVTNLLEYPVVLKGNFDKKFLELPKEVLISVMKNHQKYFPVFANSRASYTETALSNQLFSVSKDELLPHFIFACGTPVKDSNIVIEGNERVIKARFTDAQFFFREDTKTPLSEKVQKLRSMVFLSNLGTYYDKTERMEGLVVEIGTKLGFQNSIQGLKRAARLSKADLGTQMVFEFPELQGTMGKYYALISEEKEEVAKAIEEQYMPTSREGKLPETDFGSILSIADKVDSISACFISGLTPTGTSDPYALRRQAIGIINIILDKEFHLSLKHILNFGLRQIWQQLHELRPDFPAPSKELIPSPLLAEIVNFMVERFRNLMISEEFPQDIVDSVISAECDDILETERRIEALSEFRRASDFDSLAIAFKRVVNIVKGQPRGTVNPELFTPSEKQLYQSYLEAKRCVEESGSNYKEALSQMRNLKEPIDKYFTDVLVMDKNEDIRLNRLSTLWEVRDLFFKIADFSKIST